MMTERIFAFGCREMECIYADIASGTNDGAKVFETEVRKLYTGDIVTESAEAKGRM